VVFDVSNRATFDSLLDWVRSFRGVCSESAAVIIVGNKCDRRDRCVPPEDGKAWAKINEAEYIETSAKTGQGVDALFDQLAATLAPSLMCEGLPVAESVILDGGGGKKGCC
jgi:small GTP-binding protein